MTVVNFVKKIQVGPQKKQMHSPIHLFLQKLKVKSFTTLTSPLQVALHPLHLHQKEWHLYFHQK